MSDGFIRINIAVRPTGEVYEKAIEVSQSLAKKSKAYFVLDGENYFPHLTIYPPEYPKKNLKKVLQLTEEVVGVFKPFASKFAGLNQQEGYIDIEVELVDEFKNLHNALIEKLNPLREGRLRSKYKTEESLSGLSKEARRNILDYGYPDLKGLYRPHLTLVRLEDKNAAEKLASEINWDIEELRVDTVAAFITSTHGTCTEVIEEFKLRG
jgi:2'-5' RNA ligase